MSDAPSRFTLLTAAGPAAIAVVEVAGPAAAGFVGRHVRVRGAAVQTALSPGRVVRAELLDADGGAIDDILLSVHAIGTNPRMRLHLHGNPWIVNRCRALAVARGIAELPGGDLWGCGSPLEAEYHAALSATLTYRGVEWLSEKRRQLEWPSWLLPSLPAEADWGALRAALSKATDAQLAAAQRACRAAAEGLARVAWFARPLRIVLVGPPNAGKSTLTNALADAPTSLVSAAPGTTRDWVEASGELGGFPVCWVDTAGLRATDDSLEMAGIERTRALIRSADALLLVLDPTPEASDGLGEFVRVYGDLAPAAAALNKSDAISAQAFSANVLPSHWRECAVAVSALQRSGLDALERRLLRGVARTEQSLQEPAAFAGRQAAHLRAAADAHDRKTIIDNVLDIAGGEPTTT